MTERHVKPSTLSRRDWFAYRDRGDFAPDGPTMISTHSFAHQMASDIDSVSWEKEEWAAESYLVPLDGKRHATAAASVVAASLHASHVDFDPWWRSPNRFDFGESRYVGDVTVRPWIHTRTHRITDKLIVEPRPDFLRYHALDVRSSPTVSGAQEYVHPIDGAVVLRTIARSLAYFNPMPFVEVQRDYLRDYLSARRASLLIAVVADRFANAASVDELELEPKEHHRIGENAWITTTIHEKSSHNAEHAMGRSSLYWHIVVEGFPQPKRHRSPWHLHDARREKVDTDQPLPTFIADGEGRRLPANDCPWYLYFRPQVLAKYFSTPGYRAGFHMRTWGGASSPHGSIDVGINSKGLLTAFMPDVAKLPTSAQLHWASFSALPEGEVCWAMFETRMQQNPPVLPGVIELLIEGLGKLRTALETKLGIELANWPDQPPGSGQMSVGPLGSEIQEVGTLAVFLHNWITEGLAIQPLRDGLVRLGVQPDAKWRQLALLRSLLVTGAALSVDEARTIVGPLDALNEIRSKAAHLATVDYETYLPRLRLAEMPVGSRAAWDALVDSVVRAIREIEQSIAKT